MVMEWSRVQGWKQGEYVRERERALRTGSVSSEMVVGGVGKTPVVGGGSSGEESGVHA